MSSGGIYKCRQSVKESDELREGIIIDYGEDGKVVSIEMFDASENVTEPRGVLYELKESRVNTNY